MLPVTEILEESARELKMNKYTIRESVHAEKKGVMDDLIISLANKFYPSDAKVKKTLADIIRGFAQEGNVIIVGRAGVSLTKLIKNSLHIRLQAPIEWRIKIVSERQKISIDEIAAKTGTIAYEVTCNVSQRIPRIHIYK